MSQDRGRGSACTDGGVPSAAATSLVASNTATARHRETHRARPRPSPFTFITSSGRALGQSRQIAHDVLACFPASVAIAPRAPLSAPRAPRADLMV